MFTDPVKNLKQLGFREDMVVADLGAGTGFYSVAVSKLVPKGKVYAVEIQKDFLSKIKSKALEFNCNNLESFCGNIEKIGGTLIKDGIVDVAIVSNVLFQVENKEKFIEEIYRILKDVGKVLLIDWRDNSVSTNLDKKQIISKEKALALFLEKGFVLEREIEAGEYHYGIILRKDNKIK